MKYIDSEKLIAEIERRRLSNRYIDTEGYENELLGIITSLQQEQLEMDLEKSRNLIRDTLNGVTRLGSLCDDQTIEHAVDNLINELGLNARKEESK